MCSVSSPSDVPANPVQRADSVMETDFYERTLMKAPEDAENYSNYFSIFGTATEIHSEPNVRNLAETCGTF